jgi:anhydro-N-acetylmuramic acid kinase
MEKMYKVIGVMSGTSLDGIDVAYCVFIPRKKAILNQIVAAETIPYPAEWQQRLSALTGENAQSFCLSHHDYGHYVGGVVRDFISRYKVNPDFIACHGHTVFHQPTLGMTVQVGHGAAIAAETGLPVVTDFRSLDVALGGQGAPLVPIGDKVLFAKYDYCLNLGGFVNVSYDYEGRRIAYDICPCNTVLNFLAAKAGASYDNEGGLAREGKLDEKLLQKLNSLSFYGVTPPKSLGTEWVTQNIMPLLEKSRLDLKDLLRTFTEHIAMQIGAAVRHKLPSRMLITGGGAYNTFLIERIKAHIGQGIVIPGKLLIDYKEALIFAYLGVLRMEQQPNTLSTVTGARHDSCGGAVYMS